MAEKLDPRQVVTFEQLLRAMMFEQEATRRVMVRKDLLSNEEVLEEIKAVRRGMEGGGRGDKEERMVTYEGEHILMTSDHAEEFVAELVVALAL